MSERKTTEIKFRTSPTWKARVQSAAAEADESLSEFIEKAVDFRVAIDHPKTDAGGASDTRVEDSSVTQVVPTSDVADVVTKPWMFEAHSGD